MMYDVSERGTCTCGEKTYRMIHFGNYKNYVCDECVERIYRQALLEQESKPKQIVFRKFECVCGCTLMIEYKKQITRFTCYACGDDYTVIHFKDGDDPIEIEK